MNHKVKHSLHWEAASPRKEFRKKQPPGVEFITEVTQLTGWVSNLVDIKKK